MENPKQSLLIMGLVALLITIITILLNPAALPLLRKTDLSAALGTCDTSFFIINAPSGQTFTKSCLQNNTTMYTTDSRFVFFLPPPAIDGAAIIQTPNSEIKDLPTLDWSITTTVNTRVYVMPRHIPGVNAPAWIHDTYARQTNDDLTQLTQYMKRKNTDGLIGLYDIYTRDIHPGTLTLSAANDSQSQAFSMYIVALVPLSSPSTSPSPTPSPTPSRTPSPSPTPNRSPTPTPVPSATPIASPGTFAALVDSDLQYAADHYELTAQTLSKTAYPVKTGSNGAWSTSSASSWTSGFFPGSMWYLYQYSKNPVWLTRAQQWQAGIESEKNDTSTHDVGFMIFDSFGNGFKSTGTDAYRQVVLTAAHSLSTRFSPIVGATRSWNSSNFTVIIDNMMNIEMLFWAAKNGGSQQYYDMALSHALKTSQNHVRADGSTYHVVDYNPTTGAVIKQYTAQGYSDSSTWSRGQAWAIYGFTMSYRETHDQRFLDTARKVSDYYLAHLPSDYIAPWDFQAPDQQIKDTSSASTAASGLLELSKLETDTTRKATYLNAAKNIITSLSSSTYLTRGTNNNAILLHGTQNRPSGNYDTGLVFGDYYFIEALTRYKAWY